MDKGEQKIKRVALLGAGEIGGPLAARLARCGISVSLATLHLDTLAKAEKKIQASLDFRAKSTVGILDLKKKLAKAPAREKAALEAQIEALAIEAETLKQTWAGHIKTHQDPNYGHLIKFLNQDSPDLIIESVREELLTKQSIFQAWSELFGQHGRLPILATTTSSLSIAEVAKYLPEGLRHRFVGFHPFNPPDRMDLAEIVHTEQTAPGIVQEVVSFAKAIGLQPVLVRDATGFIVNRILFAYLNEAVRLLDIGKATFEEIVRSMLEFGFPMDPFRLLDFVGLDVSEAIIDNLYSSFNQHLSPPSRLFKQLLGLDRYGNKTNRGFYNYIAPRPLLDQEKERIRKELPLDTASMERLYQLGIAPERDNTSLLEELQFGPEDQERMASLLARYSGQYTGFDAEVLQLFKSLGLRFSGTTDSFDPMCLPLLMVNEAARIVEEGIASVADVDLAMDLGIRFPVTKGCGVRFSDGIFAITNEASVKALQTLYAKDEVPKNFNAGPFGWLLRYGVENVVVELETLAQWHGPQYEPASLLQQLVYGRLPKRLQDGSFERITHKRALVKPRGIRGPATEVLEEGIVPTQASLGAYQLRARVIVGDINANWKWGVRDYPIDIAKYHQETGTVIGSAGLVLVTELGREMAPLGLIRPGDIGIMLSGKHDVLTTEALGGSAQAHRSFRIHAYEAKDALEGSLSQEVVLDWSQFVKVHEGAYPFEDLGGVGLVYPTVEHSWNVLSLKKGDIVGVEGAIGATGGPGVQTAKFRDAVVVGTVSSPERGKIAMELYGADAFVDRTKHLKDDEYINAIKETLRGLTGHKRLVDKVLAYSGQGMFRKHFLSLREADPLSREDLGGELAYFGAGETGFALEVPGTSGDTPIDDMFERISKVRRERYRVPRIRRVLIIGKANEELREAVSAAKKRHSDVIIVVVDSSDEQIVRGWGLLSKEGRWPGQKPQDGIINLEAKKIQIERMPEPAHLLPDNPSPEQVQEFQQLSEAYQAYQRRSLIPFGKAIGALWGTDSTGRPLSPDVDIVLLDGDDGANILNYLAFTGFFTQVGYPNDTSKMNLRWHAALGWMNQNSIVLTKKVVLGAHYASPAESAAVIDWIMRGVLRPPRPHVFWPKDTGIAQEAIGTGKNVILIGVPRLGLKTLAEAYRAQEIQPLISQLGYEKPGVRQLAAQKLYRIGAKAAYEMLDVWRENEALREVVFGPPVVGVAVYPERFETIRKAWGSPPLADMPPEQEVEEFELNSGPAHLDILRPKQLSPKGDTVLEKFLQKNGEGIQQVELWTTNAKRATEVLKAEYGDTLRVVYDSPQRGANGTLVNFVLSPQQDGTKLLIELVELGPEARFTGAPKIMTETDVLIFAKSSGDRNPFHLDEAYAKKSRYQARIAHGILTAGCVLASVEHFLPGYSLDSVEVTKFNAPVMLGDSIIPEVRVVKMAGKHAKVKISALNLQGTALLEGHAEVSLRGANSSLSHLKPEEPGELLRKAQMWAYDVRAFTVRPAPNFKINDTTVLSGTQSSSPELKITDATFDAARALFGNTNPHINALLGMGAIAHTSAMFAPGYILLGVKARQFDGEIKPGDVLSAKATISNVETTKSGKSLIKIAIEILNQAGKKLLIGEVTKLRAEESVSRITT